MIADMHKAVESLMAKGASKEFSEAIVEVISSVENTVATKNDIENLRREMDTYFNWIKAIGLLILVSIVKLAWF